MKKKTTSKKSQTNWKHLKAMKDKDIDLSDNPELTPEMFARSIVRRGLIIAPRKVQLTLRVNNDDLEWYKKLGRGFQTQNCSP